jgi:hypothetical protein
MKSWGRYELAPAPADADLILEISLANPIERGGSASDFLLKLVIVDPKTHAPLWWFTESFATKGGYAHRKDTLTSNFDRSSADLVDDLGKLVGASAVVPPEPKR